MTAPVDYFVGLDLGKVADFTALAVLERRHPPPPGRDEPRPKTPPKPRHVVSLLRRWPRGTSYPDIVRDVGELLVTAHPITQVKPLLNCVLGVDETGVGKAIVDMLREAKLPCSLHPVLITGGHEVTRVEGVWHAAKKELVSTLQVLLQGSRLEVAAVPGAEVLRQELLSFRVKITTTGNESFEAWREKDHDDLVLAVAISAFLASRLPRQANTVPRQIRTRGYSQVPGGSLPPPPAEWFNRRME